MAENEAAPGQGKESRQKAGSDEGTKEGQGDVCTFMKPKRRDTMRKRNIEETAEADNSTSVMAKLQAEKDKDSKGGSVFSSKKEKLDAETVLASANAFNFKASGTATSIVDNRATAYNIAEVDEIDHKSEVAKKPKEEEIITDPDEIERLEKSYKGMNNYQKLIEKRAVKVGPQRSTLTIRLTSFFDYKPDLCKDYKETGYCGFGDSCKFMHDRGDYKSGWQLEKEWEEKQKSGKATEESLEVEEKKEDDIPFACFICRKPFTNPVVTKCGHYFCEKCALRHNAKSSKCAVCSQPTLATKLINAQKRKAANPTSYDPPPAAIPISIEGEEGPE